MSLNFKILTYLPDIYPGPLSSSVVGRALEKNIFSLETFAFADYAINNQVDDTPYGGGSGMVTRADVVGNAIDDILTKSSGKTQIIYPSPRGNILKQKKIVEFVKENNNVLAISGRFEGIDQRILDYYDIFEFSIGDFVLSGGDIPIMSFIDASVRLLPNVIGDNESLMEESFTPDSDFENLLEYSHYTRPSKWRDMDVDDVLLSGNHAKIKEWRLDNAQKLTKTRRPDLLK
ncbi:MAG: tRNA (guanosine(37)-N1)-methyltransferase TrmD [Rickettsiales bacterium]|nr:tRNA (guanosine(37)-N1)-methyltransferase TrmD [Rickettsiales bacterium]